MIRIYMVVTADIFELPICVTQNIDDLAAMFNTSRAVIFSAISKQYKVALKYKIIRLKFTAKEWEALDEE